MPRISELLSVPELKCAAMKLMRRFRRPLKSFFRGDCEDTYFAVGDTGKFMVDLKETNRRLLVQLGLKSENISVSDECTSCNSDKYWSHRATKGERGSQAAVIVVS